MKFLWLYILTHIPVPERKSPQVLNKYFICCDVIYSAVNCYDVDVLILATDGEESKDKVIANYTCSTNIGICLGG